MVGVNGDSGKYGWTGSLGLYCIDSGVVLVRGSSESFIVS